MGMAYPEKVVKPKPCTEGNVVCDECHGEYNPKLNWHRGYFSDGTTNEFTPLYKLKDSECPCCGKVDE